ncbi:keratin 3-like [Micromonospora aurantiaca ATCC 27029]|nr:keratin 3-like [Micromonospora aurantiaca ATCC 27029]
MGGRDAGGRDVGGGGHGGLGWMGAVSGLRRVSGFGVVGDTRLAESWAGPGRYTW